MKKILTSIVIATKSRPAPKVPSSVELLLKDAKILPSLASTRIDIDLLSFNDTHVNAFDAFFPKTWKTATGNAEVCTIRGQSIEQQGDITIAG